MPHFWGCAPPWGYDPQILTWPRVLYSAVNAATLPEFHHPMCTGLEVVVLTNKRTNRRR